MHFTTICFSFSFCPEQNGWDARGAAAAAAVHFNEAGHRQDMQTEDGGAAVGLAGMALPRRETTQFLLHPLYLLTYTLTLAATSRLTDTLSSSQSTFIVVSVVLLRSAGCVTLPSLPIILRPAVTYLAGLLGVLLAKFTETSLIQPDVVPILNNSNSLANPQLPPLSGGNGGGAGSRRTSAVDHESRVMAARRRRTSSAALTSTQASAASSAAGQSGASQGNATGNNKVRRTSLPALLANKKDHLLVSVSPFIVFWSIVFVGVSFFGGKSTGCSDVDLLQNGGESSLSNFEAASYFFYCCQRSLFGYLLPGPVGANYALPCIPIWNVDETLMFVARWRLDIDIINDLKQQTWTGQKLINSCVQSRQRKVLPRSQYCFKNYLLCRYTIGETTPFVLSNTCWTKKQKYGRPITKPTTVNKRVNLSSRLKRTCFDVE